MIKKEKKILIIKNELSSVWELTSLLKSYGFRVFEVTGERKGLKFVLDNHPDLILIDIFIPKTDGMAVLKKLRTDSWGKDVPVIILSNLSDTETVATALENKVYIFLVRSNCNLADVAIKIKEKLSVTSGNGAFSY